MERLRYRFLLVILLFVSFAFLTKTYGFKGRERDNRANHLADFPLQIGNWKGERSFIEEKVYRILETDAVLVNQYRNGNDAVSLSIVYYPDAKVDFHNPESCNRGKGDIVEKLGNREIAVRMGKRTIPLRVNIFKVTRENGGKDLFYYFFKSGKYVGNRYIQLRLEMALKTLQRKDTSGSLIVFSTPLKYDQSSTEGLMNRFIHMLYPLIIQYV